MPVIVGVVVGIVFLVAFSEWFFHLVAGWKEFVLDDVFFRYRVAGMSLLTILVMGGAFWGMALVTECKEEKETEGIFASLNCEEYQKIKVGAEKLFLPED